MHENISQMALANITLSREALDLQGRVDFSAILQLVALSDTIMCTITSYLFTFFLSALDSTHMNIQ